MLAGPKARASKAARNAEDGDASDSEDVGGDVGDLQKVSEALFQQRCLAYSLTERVRATDDFLDARCPYPYP
jgi:hypothetical protein